MYRSSTFTIVIIFALSLALTACAEEKPSDPRTQAPLVRTATIDASSVESRSFTGVVAARVESDLGFRVAGKVSKRLVDKGQTVKKGQVLMQLDSNDLNLAASAQEEAVVAAMAGVQQTAKDEVRYRELLSIGAVSESAYDQVKSAADTAAAQLRAAQAQAEVAVNTTRYTNLIADANGTIVETLAEPGQVVSAGQTVVRIAHSGAREAVVQLPETLRPALGTSGQAQLFGKRNISSTATLRQLSDAADPATRTFEARYVLTGALRDAPLGSTINMTIADERSMTDGGLYVPIGALSDSEQETGVWIVTGKPSIVSWQPVTVLSLEDDIALVTGQVKEGEQVVALGAHLLHEGEQVRVMGTSTDVLLEGAQP